MSEAFYVSPPFDLTIPSGLSPKAVLKGRYTEDTENMWVRIFVTAENLKEMYLKREWNGNNYV